MRGRGARLRRHRIVSGIRHFIGLDAFEPTVLRHMIERAAELKRTPETGQGALAGKTLAMIFETPSTRTRISFDVAMNKLGGRSIALSPGSTSPGAKASRGSSRSTSLRVRSWIYWTADHAPRRRSFTTCLNSIPRTGYGTAYSNCNRSEQSAKQEPLRSRLLTTCPRMVSR